LKLARFLAVKEAS